MGPRTQQIDPYLVMMKQLERRMWACGLIAVMTFVGAFLIASGGNDGAGLLGPVVGQIRHMISLGFFCAGGLAWVLLLWFVGQYVYYTKWPERFQEDEDV